jgi:hypothetical protein
MWAGYRAPFERGARGSPARAARSCRSRAPPPGSRCSARTLTSCLISSIGKSGARASGPMGSWVAGCSGGAGGVRQVRGDVVPVRRHLRGEDDLLFSHGAVPFLVFAASEGLPRVPDRGGVSGSRAALPGTKKNPSVLYAKDEGYSWCHLCSPARTGALSSDGTRSEEGGDRPGGDNGALPPASTWLSPFVPVLPGPFTCRAAARIPPSPALCMPARPATLPDQRSSMKLSMPTVDVCAAACQDNRGPRLAEGSNASQLALLTLEC